MTSDAQAALAAAALIMAATRRGPSITSEQDTLNMADGFLRWLRRPGHTTVERHVDERLIPNEDFRSPSAARTAHIDPSAVLAAAADPTMPLRTVERHMLDPVQRTPSGKFACLCGESWPCSQRESAPG